MSLITQNTGVRSSFRSPLTVDVITRQLRDGLAPVTEPRRDSAAKIVVTWAVAPNRPTYGLGFAMRDRQRDHLEGVPHAS